MFPCDPSYLVKKKKEAGGTGGSRGALGGMAREEGRERKGEGVAREDRSGREIPHEAITTTRAPHDKEATSKQNERP